MSGFQLQRLGTVMAGQTELAIEPHDHRHLMESICRGPNQRNPLRSKKFSNNEPVDQPKMPDKPDVRRSKPDASVPSPRQRMHAKTESKPNS